MLMREVSHRLAGGVPFAMQPVVYDFSINEHGTYAELLTGNSAKLPDGYYNLILPALLRRDQRSLSSSERSDLERFSSACHGEQGAEVRTQNFLDRLLPQGNGGNERQESLDSLLAKNGFDPIQHERIQAALRAGRIGLAQNRRCSTRAGPGCKARRGCAPEEDRRRGARLRHCCSGHARRRRRQPLDKRRWSGQGT